MHDSIANADSDKGSWIPLFPGHETLEHVPQMMRAFGDTFALPTARDPAVAVYLVSKDASVESRFQLLFSNPLDYVAGHDSNTPYWIEDLAPNEGNSLDGNIRKGAAGSEICLIIRNTSGAVLKGVRLIVTRRDGDNLFLRYGCALRISKGKTHPLTWPSPPPVFGARTPGTDTKLYLEHGSLSPRCA
jgi:hypothetical protein